MVSSQKCNYKLVYFHTENSLMSMKDVSCWYRCWNRISFWFIKEERHFQLIRLDFKHFPNLPLKKFEYLEDALRYQIEDSDQILGFNMYLDVHNGFGYIADWIINYLQEEVPKAGIVLRSVINNELAENKVVSYIISVYTYKVWRRTNVG